jgi:hypothetical protein
VQINPRAGKNTATFFFKQIFTLSAALTYCIQRNMSMPSAGTFSVAGVKPGSSG